MLLPSTVDAQGAGEADVPRGGSHVYLIVAARRLPAVRIDVPVRQRMRCGVRVQGHSNLLGLAWCQLDFRPAYQPFERLARACRQSEVHLRNLGTHTSTGIRDCEAHLHVPGAIGGLGFHLELSVGEAGVGEPVAEREERLDPALVVAPVADTEALAVGGDGAVWASILLRWGNRGVVIATRKSERQLTRRGDV